MAESNRLTSEPSISKSKEKTSEDFNIFYCPTEATFRENFLNVLEIESKIRHILGQFALCWLSDK